MALVGRSSEAFARPDLTVVAQSLAGRGVFSRRPAIVLRALPLAYSFFRFLKGPRYDDFIDVCVRTTRIGRTSLRLALEIHRGDDHLVTGELVYVIADPRTQKPVPIPDTMREAILRYEPAAPEQ